MTCHFFRFYFNLGSPCYQLLLSGAGRLALPTPLVSFLTWTSRIPEEHFKTLKKLTAIFQRIKFQRCCIYILPPLEIFYLKKSSLFLKPWYSESVSNQTLTSRCCFPERNHLDWRSASLAVVNSCNGFLLSKKYWIVAAVNIFWTYIF